MTFAARPGLRRVSARDVPPADVPGHSFRIVADSADTAGIYSLTEATSPVGAAVPPHAHDDAVECFFIAEGEYRLTVSGQTRTVGPGDFQLVPRGAPHHFEVLGTGRGRAIVLFTPAGFETVFRRMPEIFGTPGEPGPLWGRLNAQFGTRLLHDVADPPPGPPAIVVPARTDADAGSTTLAAPTTTGTRLDISVRSDPDANSVWHVPPGTTAIWIVSGRYHLELPDCSVTLTEGDYLTIDEPAQARAVALSPFSQALYLRI